MRSKASAFGGASFVLRPRSSPWQRELDDLVRALSGGFLFGAPLLFTMEMWQLGTYASTWKLLALLGIALLANYGLAYFAGFKREHRAARLDQALDATAVGALSAVIILLALNRLEPGEPLSSVLGKVVVLSVPLGIGASVANAVFGRAGGRQGDEQDSGERDYRRATLRDVGATTVGGVLLGSSIAPTDEIPMLAAEMTSGHLIAVVLLSIGLTYAIVFASGFDPERAGPKPAGAFQTPWSETALAYTVSLAVALLSLFLFDRLGAGVPLDYAVGQVLVLGLPTAIGGAAGRLVL
jgi:putative integral membrane protein (TIGR02587 family)